LKSKLRISLRFWRAHPGDAMVHNVLVYNHRTTMTTRTMNILVRLKMRNNQLQLLTLLLLTWLLEI
jgi:hypothetical protein